MRQRWIVPIGGTGNAEIMIERDGGMFIYLTTERGGYPHKVGISEERRLDLIEALKAAGRSRAGIVRTMTAKDPEPSMLEVKSA